MRSFIAVEIDDAIRERLGQRIEAFRSAGAQVRWVAPQNIHLTLKFLGEIDPERVPDVEQVMKEATREVAPFEIELREIGAFPSLSRPRVIWVGCRDETGGLWKIFRVLERGLVPLGIEKEKRRFSPHLTVGRIKSKGRDRRLDFLKGELKAHIDFVAGRQRVSGITLFKSQLTPRGAIYTVVRTAKLSPAGGSA